MKAVLWILCHERYAMDVVLLMLFDGGTGLLMPPFERYSVVMQTIRNVGLYELANFQRKRLRPQAVQHAGRRFWHELYLV